MSTSVNESGSIEQPGAVNYILAFVAVGCAWGLTTPFIRRAARTHSPAPHPILEAEHVRTSFLRSRIYGAFFAVIDLLRNPRYAIPLLLNLTGSVWFFLLIGKAELSLTVPIVNTMAFLFTVIGEWWVESKVISRGISAPLHFLCLFFFTCCFDLHHHRRFPTLENRRYQCSDPISFS